MPVSCFVLFENFNVEEAKPKKNFIARSHSGAKQGCVVKSESRWDHWLATPLVKGHSILGQTVICSKLSLIALAHLTHWIQVQQLMCNANANAKV